MDKTKTLEEFGISKHQPMYVYQQAMFMLTVSVVLIDENGVIVMKDEECGHADTDADADADTTDKLSIFKYRFPGGLVKAGQETIQFSAVRQVKEQTGIVMQKEALIPVDFRSSPERSKEGNVVDIGMVSILNHSVKIQDNCKWLPVNFEQSQLCDNIDLDLYMDHDILLARALDVALMIKG